MTRISEFVTSYTIWLFWKSCLLQNFFSLIIYSFSMFCPTFWLHYTLFRRAYILSSSGLTNFRPPRIRLLSFQFFSWKHNGLGINPAISRNFYYTQKRQWKSAKKRYFEHVWAKVVQPSMLTWYQWTCSKRN